MSKREYGTGLTNLECAPLCKITVRNCHCMRPIGAEERPLELLCKRIQKGSALEMLLANH